MDTYQAQLAIQALDVDVVAVQACVAVAHVANNSAGGSQTLDGADLQAERAQTWNQMLVVQSNMVSPSGVVVMNGVDLLQATVVTMMLMVLLSKYADIQVRSNSRVDVDGLM